MNRIAGRFALVAVLAIPAGISAQQKEPPDTKQTKEVEKFIGMAMLRQTPEQKKPVYEQALKPMAEAIAKDPANAKVWYLAGQVYTGLNDFVGADSAFKKAEQLYPPYAEELAGEREVAWIGAFQAASASMDAINGAADDAARAQKTRESIAAFELAERLYPHRPEGKLNLGALYASIDDAEKAEAAFRGAIAAAEGPLKEKLPAEELASWQRYSAIATSNIAQMAGAKGVDHFQAERFDDAAAAFEKALALNPHSRDYVYNHAQAVYAKATKIEDARDKLMEEAAAATKAKKAAEAQAKTDEANKLNQQLVPLYAKIIEGIRKTQQLDPEGEGHHQLVARSTKLTGDIVAKTDAEKTEYQQKTLAELQKREAQEFEVAEIAVVGAGDGQNATIRGSVKNLKAAAGSQIRLKFTLLDLKGATVGEQEVTVAAPAAEASAPFEVAAKTTGEVAGWKYAVVK